MTCIISAVLFLVYLVFKPEIEKLAAALRRMFGIVTTAVKVEINGRKVASKKEDK